MNILENTGSIAMLGIAFLQITLQFAKVKVNGRMLVHALLSHSLINISSRQKLI
tara:strand:- start:223 stop:384 length:162 start_codon:yes stop_codon:yes gene_type:complete